MRGRYLGIVDADSIVYKVAHINNDCEEGEAVMALDSFIYTMIKLPTQCDKYIFCISKGHSGRNEIAVTKPYKGNRPKIDKPIHFNALMDYLETQYAAIGYNQYEADDLVISLHDRYKSESVLIGIDKDNLQSVGLHFNYDKNEFIEIDANTADYNFCMQMLMGDVSDNISGIPKTGKKTAEKILADTSKPYIEIVFDTYMASGNTGDSILDKIAYFKEQYGLLRMIKDINYPFELHFIELPEVQIECADLFEEIN